MGPKSEMSLLGISTEEQDPDLFGNHTTRESPEVGLSQNGEGIGLACLKRQAKRKVVILKEYL